MPLRDTTSHVPLESGALGCAHTKRWWVGRCPAQALGSEGTPGLSLGTAGPSVQASKGFVGVSFLGHSDSRCKGSCLCC